MNTDVELIAFARQLRIPLRFIGSKDELKETRLQPGAYIVNLQDDLRADGVDLTGTHWVALWVERGSGVYFNSFGMAPPADIQLFAHKLQPFYYNMHQIQNIQSGHCGIYVLFFLYWMSQYQNVPLKKRFDNFLRLWSVNPVENLTILKQHMKQFFWINFFSYGINEYAV